MNTLTQLLLKALLASISPGVASAINRWALKRLANFAATTDTDLDEKIVKVLQQFLNTANPNP